MLTLLAIAVVGVVAVLIARGEPILEEDAVDIRALRWPPDGPLRPDDLDDVRFTVTVRGYRMDEVDRVLDDVRLLLAQQGARIAELESHGVPDAGTTDGGAADPAAVISADAGHEGRFMGNNGPERPVLAGPANGKGTEHGGHEAKDG